MKFGKVSLGTLLVAGVCVATFSAKAYICPIPIFSTYENAFPDFRLAEEAVLTLTRQVTLWQKELEYTDALGKRKNGYLRPVRGVKGDHNEIITQMQKAAGESANIIQKSGARIDGVGDLGNYASAQGQMKSELTVRPYAERGGKNYTTGELNDILENQRTAVNDFSASAIGMGATISVNAAVAAEESIPKERSKQIAKAKTLAELYELMLGLDRRIYERSLLASAAEATVAEVEALRVLTGASTTSSGQ